MELKKLQQQWNSFPETSMEERPVLSSDLEKIVVDKIAGFSNDRLEAMLNEFLTKEFRFVEVIGAALGFLIGLLQIGMTLLMK